MFKDEISKWNDSFFWLDIVDSCIKEVCLPKQPYKPLETCLSNSNTVDAPKVHTYSYHLDTIPPMFMKKPFEELGQTTF